MSTHPYIPLYVDDYDAHTSHLTPAEDGIYGRLLRLTWRTPGCSLPDDPAWIARKIRVSAEDYAVIAQPVIDEFFKLKRGRLVQGRLKDEYDDISRKKSARKAAGKKGGDAKALKQHANSPSNATDLLGDAGAFPNPEPNPEPQESSEGKPSALDDPNATAWKLAKDILIERGGQTAAAAGKFFGGLLTRHQLEAREMLTSLAGAQVNGTLDPQAYLAKAAQGVVRRRAEIALQQESGNEQPRAPTTRQTAYVDRLQDIDRAMELAFEPGPGGGRDRDDYP